MTEENIMQQAAASLLTGPCPYCGAKDVVLVMCGQCAANPNHIGPMILCQDCHAKGRCHNETSLHCDFCTSAHIIQGNANTVTNEEMRKHPHVYAALIWEQCPPSVRNATSEEDKETFLAEMRAYALSSATLDTGAKIQPATMDGVILGPNTDLHFDNNNTDWCVCDEMLARWNALKEEMGEWTAPE